MRLRAMDTVYTITHRKSMLKIKVKLPEMKHPLRLEAEFVVLGNTRLHVVKKEVRRWDGGGRIIYYVEER